MPPFTLTAPPGLSDLPDAALNAEEIAQGQHAVKILENTKFGVVRPEFFYMGRFSDGQTVARPISKVDNLPYQASEIIYLWEIVLSADPRDGITSGAGTILYFDYQVDQKDKSDPGLVHCKTVYHVQGGQTTETQDGELSVWAIGIRGLDQLSLAAVPAWTNVPDTNFDLDSAWREDRLKDLNAAAKRSVVQAEFFDMGEFGNGQTVPQPVSDVDGFTYPYADLVFLTSWRWSPAFATGISSGPLGATLARLEKNVVGATGVVDTTVTYRLGASLDTVTQDGRVRVFAFGFRAGITATGTVSFTDLNANIFLPGKPPLDDDTLVMVRNSKFAALRPEFFVTTQAHGTTVPLPTSPIDSYAYARSELVYLYERSDTAAPGSIGSLLTLHGFIRQDTGAVTINTLYFNQGGAQTNTNNGTFRVVTVALRSKDVEVDSDPNTAGGGEPGFEGNVDNDLLSGGGIVLMRNANFESGDGQWTLGTGFGIIEQPGDAYDGDWVLRFVGTGAAAARNIVTIPMAPTDVLRASCFIKRVSGDGSPRVRISWRDVNKNEFATTLGTVVTSSAFALSRVVGRAPTGTFFAVVECSVGTSTVTTTIFYDQFNVTFFPIDLDDVDGSPTRSSIDPNFLDSGLRPTKLRRILEGADLDGDDIIKILEESRLNALSLQNAPSEAGANVTETRTAALIAGQGALATKSAVDLATAEVLNRTAANIAETGIRKWLPDLLRIFTTSGKASAVEGLESGGNVAADKVVEGSLLAGALALAKMKADSLARMFTLDAKRTNVEALEAGGNVATNKVVETSLLAGAVALGKQKADSLARMFTTDVKRTNIEAKEPAEVNADATTSHWLDVAVTGALAFLNLGGGSTASDGWRRVSQIDKVIGADVTALEFNITALAEVPGPPNVVNLETIGDNVGIIVATAPGLSETPTNTRAGNGTIAYGSPPTGARKVALYIKCNILGPGATSVGANYAWKIAAVNKQ